MMRGASRLLYLLLAVCALCLKGSSGEAESGLGKTLVLLDTAATRDTHSKFFATLEAEGHTLKYALADSPKLNLFKYGELIFQNLIIFAPSVAEFGGAVNVGTITEFVDEGGNILLATSTDVGDAIREFASEVGFEIDEEQTYVIDYVSNDGGDETIVTSSNFVNAPVITGDVAGKNVYFHGVGMVADPENPLAFSILSGSSTSYSYSPTDEITTYPLAVGKNTVLVGGVQARNNARVVLSGSLELFSNAFFSKDGANEEFAASVASWTFQQRGVLRLATPVHHRVGESAPPREYTITENVHYEIKAEEKVDGLWIPFRETDVQLEFVRIDPFYRRTLNNTNGVLHTDFVIPDVYGVFKFVVDYKRIGYTFLFDSQQVSVRPFLHTQYERFIVAAYPYYAGAFSMMFGLFIFSIVYLHNRSKVHKD